MKELLKAQQISKSYLEREVVSKVELEVAPAEVVGLLGPNGAGKTTTFYMMVGLVLPDEGRIYLNGEDITSLPIHQRALKGIGYLPQEASIFRDLTVEENIVAVLEGLNLSRSQQKTALESLISDFGLGKISQSKGSDLSGGERRRVEIARTLALRPQFVLLDEPFAGVDPLAVSDIQGIINDLKKRSIGVLITDHSVRETLKIVDRAYIMKSGQVLVQGPPETIINDERAKEFYLGKDFSL